MGQLLALRAFGSKKCVVRAFVVTPDIHSFFSLWSSEASRAPKILLEDFFVWLCLVALCMINIVKHSRSVRVLVL